jgi:hypothetical protein
MTKIEIKKVREFFEAHHSYIDINGLADLDIAEYLTRRYVKDLDFNKQMDLLYDYILSQNLCHVTP